MKPIRIIVHTTADYRITPQFDIVNKWHRQQGFPISSLGYYCGYTYFIERDGTLIQARKDDEEQAHVQGFNQDSIGIGLALDGDRERPSVEQWLVLKNLINKKMAEWEILPANIDGHRAFTSLKTCPGIKISDLEIKLLFQPDIAYLQRIILKIQQLIANLKSSEIGKIKVEEDKYN